MAPSVPAPAQRLETLDPELEALPEPRRPWRRATLGTMGLTALLSFGLAWALRAPAAFAMWSGPPRNLGALTGVQPDSSAANAWVRVRGDVGPRAVEYQRPLDPDRHRLAPIVQDADGSSRVWVELRIPSSIEPERYVAPNSFVGRLVPLDGAGLRQAALAEAIETAMGAPAPRDAWVLVDGEAPATTRWALGLVLLFVAFGLFNVWGIWRLSRPVTIVARPTQG